MIAFENQLQAKLSQERRSQLFDSSERAYQDDANGR